MQCACLRSVAAQVVHLWMWSLLRAAELLGGGGPLAALRPLLPAVCQMAACEASAAAVPGAPAAAGQADEDGWGEAALDAALTAVCMAFARSR